MIDFICEALKARYPRLRPTFGRFPDRGIPLAMFAHSALVAAIQPRGATQPLRGTQFTLEKEVWDTLDGARLSTLKAYREKNRLAESPPQIWIIAWAMDGLWGQEISYIPEDAVWPFQLENKFWVRLSKIPYGKGERSAGNNPNVLAQRTLQLGIPGE